jgi:hypothetical protein
MPGSNPASEVRMKRCALVGTSVCPSAGYDQMIRGSGAAHEARAGELGASADKQIAARAHDPIALDRSRGPDRNHEMPDVSSLMTPGQGMGRAGRGSETLRKPGST